MEEPHAPPVLTADANQLLDGALRQAVGQRHEYVETVQDLKAGGVSIHELLADPPDPLLTAKVFDVLLAVPKLGRVRVSKLLSACRIAPSTTIGGLSQRQRDELIAHL